MFAAVFIFAAFLSAESLVSTIVGGLVSLGITHVFKKSAGLQGAGAAILAFAVSVVVAAAAYVITAMLNGGDVTLQTIPQNAAQIFTLATLAYKLAMADNGENQ